MRAILLTLPLVFVLPPLARADQATDLRDKALKALAKDPADLKKLRAYTMKAKGITRLGPEPMPATWEIAAVWPGQFRGTWEWGVGASKNSVVQCVSDDRGWRRVGSEPPIDLLVEQLNDLRADAYAIWVATLITLTDADTKLAYAGEDKHKDIPLQGLKITRRPWPDITLYFDKDGLLRKMTYRSRDTGVNLTKEMIFDGHKEVSGLKMPTKQSIIVQNKESFTWTEMEYAFPDRIDPKTFQKPK
jgi:hypothetical protein